MSARPLLYLSLPGLAFILGVVWFRRRNRSSIDKRESDDIKTKAKMLDKSAEENNKTEESLRNTTLIASKSINIIEHNSGDDENSATKLFGKSAPITIVQNSRKSSPEQMTQPEKSESDIQKINEDTDPSVMRSIEEDFENLSSPPDLPDSASQRSFFYPRMNNSKKEEPIIIKASKSLKVSPDNLFAESNYIKSEPNNNISSKKTEASKEEGLQKESPKESNGNTVVSENDSRTTDAASPPLSVSSVQSGDSGKGSSLPRSEATGAKFVYEFFLPNMLVGTLYGRRHFFLNQIQTKTSATIVIRSEYYQGKLHICRVEGTERAVNEALRLIRDRLPLKRYPNFTMDRIHLALPQTVVPLSIESLFNLQLSLIEGINNDVIVSTAISVGHIFVQQPLHPSHPSLAVLQKCLYESYTSIEAPALPRLELNAVCVIQTNDAWYRVQIVERDPTGDDSRCIVKYLDFGGYMNVSFSDLRQIRTDFMELPFQATECLLSNIEPIDVNLSVEGANVLCKLTTGIVLQAQIVGYNSQNIPEINLYACLGPNNVIFINKELVARNLARWVE